MGRGGRRGREQPAPAAERRMTPAPLGFVLAAGSPAAAQPAPPATSCPRCAEPTLSVEIMEQGEQLRVNPAR